VGERRHAHAITERLQHAQAARFQRHVDGLATSGPEALSAGFQHPWAARHPAVPSTSAQLRRCRAGRQPHRPVAAKPPCAPTGTYLKDELGTPSLGPTSPFAGTCSVRCTILPLSRDTLMACPTHRG